jgi:hypothetical protein
LNRADEVIDPVECRLSRAAPLAGWMGNYS